MQLEASFYHFIRTEQDCNKLLERFAIEMGYNKAYERIDKMRGCGGSKNEKVIAETKNFEFYSCPCQFISSEFIDIITLVAQRKKGNLPFSGGVLEQPARLIEAMDIVEEMLNEYKEQIRKIEERKAKGRKK